MIRRKPLKRRHRACGRPTKAQQAHQDAQRAHGCAMCHLLELDFGGLPDGVSPCGRTAVHHRTTGDLHGQKQLGQGDTVALGDYHHQGIPLPGRQEASMRDEFGPSLQLHKSDFLNLLDDLLGERSTAALQRWQDAQIAGEQPA